MTNEIIFDDKLKEECGVFGVYKTASSTADYVYYGLHALQHRGQESAGIAANDNGVITQIKGMGLVGDVFKPVSYTHLVIKDFPTPPLPLTMPITFLIFDFSFAAT